MKAIALEGPGAAPALLDVETPTPAAGEVLVRVRASSANPVDNAIAAGMLAGMAEHDFPVVLGRDYAGVVEEVGSGVAGFAAGDEVYGYIRHANPAVHEGSWAELIAVGQDESIARAPAGLDLATVGASALAGITALLLVDALELSEGDTALIVGAAGGVGTFAVQLAAHAGATVVAPALDEDVAYLRELGVSDVIPRDGDIAAAFRERYPDGANALLDAVTFAPGAYDAALASGARVSSPNGAAGDGPGRTNVMAEPSRENLERLAGLLADGTLRVPVQRSYGLAQAADALGDLHARHTQGKLAIRIG